MPAIDKLRKGADKANAKLAAQGLGGRLYDVLVAAWVEGDPIAGTAGSWGAPITLDPRPSTEIKAVWRTQEGGRVKVGDVRVSKISRANYTREQLQGSSSVASRWSINGKPYALVELLEQPTEWIAILKGEV